MSDMELLGLNETETHYLQQVRQAMETYFANDVRRISHAHDVTAYARSLLEYIDAEPVLTLTAAYLHDIGIPEAERKFGRCDGKIQEQEGPPVAQMILADLGADAAFIERVCELVGHHHTPGGVDSPEFRILWDADALVNLEEVVSGKQAYVVESILNKALVTEPGYRMARRIYLAEGNPSN
jgi:HD superfamily phosphodiesterase